MCGRAYSTVTQDEMEAKYLTAKRKRDPLGIKNNYNLAPTQMAAVVRAGAKEREIALLKWGLVPFWAKDLKIGSKMINARAETVAEKPAFRAAIKKRRCIVPLSGFYEWKTLPDGKHPFAISAKDGSVLSAAGLWEEWDNKGELKEPVQTFTIITTGANTFMNDIHDRMPVFLDDKAVEAWLDAEVEDPAKVVKLLKPAPDSWFKAHEVSIAVNSPRNNTPEVLKAVGA